MKLKRNKWLFDVKFDTAWLKSNIENKLFNGLIVYKR